MYKYTIIQEDLSNKSKLSYEFSAHDEGEFVENITSFMHSTGWIIDGSLEVNYEDFDDIDSEYNDYRNPDYAVGYAISRTPLGPWEKMKTNPLISKLDSNAGTGHGDLFYDKRGRMKYVLHTHLSNEEVGPRKTAILELSLKNQKLSVKNNSFYFVEKQ